jgi:glycosyltransferase involved in cell wall biosynthesis
MMWAWGIAGAALGAVWVWCVIDAFVGMRRVPDLAATDFDVPPWNEGGHAPSVCIVVPARNEAEHVEAAVRSLLALDYPRFRIIAVNDRSTDGTGEILDRLAAEAPACLQVIRVASLPPDWLGKTHAMWMAAQRASEDWLLFTDADVCYRADALRRAVGYAEASHGDHLAVFPRIETRTIGGHALVAFFGMLFMFWHRPWKVADPGAADCIGLGAFNLIRREAYERVGTWKALAMAVVDDMMLGEAVKRHGLAQRAAIGLDLVSVSWVRDGREVVRNLTKNFFAVTRYKWFLALGACAVLLLLNVAPFAGVVVAPRWSKLGFGAAVMAIGTVYVRMSRQSAISPLYVFLHPLSALVFIYTLLRSMMLTLWRGGVVWRGTKYPLDDLRR